jgi:transposase
MAHFVGLDVSVKATSVCVVDHAGKVILEQKVPTEPADIIALLTSLGVTFGRIGIEAVRWTPIVGQPEPFPKV